MDKEGTNMSDELSKWFKVTFHTGLFIPTDYWIDVVPIEFVGKGEYVDKYRDESLPEWIRDRVSLLRLVEPGTDIGGVGKRHSKDVFFIKKEN